MNKEELLKVLPCLSIFPWTVNSSDLRMKAVQAMLEESKNYNALNEIFGVTNHRYEELVDLPKDKDDDDLVFKYLISVLPDDDIEKYKDTFVTMFKENKMPSGKKFTKHLLEAYYTREGLIKINKHAIHIRLREQTEQLPNTGSVNFLTDYEIILKGYIESLKTSSQVHLGIAWDYEMILNCMSSTAYTSCRSVRQQAEKGLYHPYHLMRTETGAVIYLRKGQTVIGRCVIFFSDNYKSFAVKTLYGAITKAQVEIILDYVMRKISPDGTWIIRSDPSMGRLFTLQHNPLNYDDPQIYEASCDVREGKFFRMFVESKKQSIDTKCPVCGEIIRIGDSNVTCQSCLDKARTRCIHCQQIRLTHNGYCMRCTERKHNVCQLCNKENPVYSNTGRCAECYIKDRCSLCGQPHTDPLVEVMPNVNVCNDCIKEMNEHETCRFCGDDSVMIRGGYIMCSPCYVNLMFAYWSHNTHYRQTSIPKDERTSHLFKTVPDDLKKKYSNFIKNNKWQPWALTDNINNEIHNVFIDIKHMIE